jgi:glucans biosynthesis protein C
MNDKNMLHSERRYDIDWVRVIAISLLLIYHVAIGFQPWGVMIRFIANSKSWTSLWVPMMMLNVWRIPLLFFVSGMGIYFAMQNRNWKQLLGERAARILVPFLFGVFVIVPIHMMLWEEYYHMRLNYTPDSGHLWFLGNIVVYVIVFLPLFFYLKLNEQGVAVNVIRKMFSTPLGLLVVVAAFMAEVAIIKPMPYELYAMTWHGFFLGMIAFFFGFCLVLSGSVFWTMISKWRWMFLVIALSLFIVRLIYFPVNTPGYLLVMESQCWIMSVLAWAYRHLNKPSKALTYLSQAAYPVYILHMIFLYIGSLFIFRWDIPVQVQFVLVLLFTACGCFATYELIRRVKIIRPLFGLKY